MFLVFGPCFCVFSDDERDEKKCRDVDKGRRRELLLLRRGLEQQPAPEPSPGFHSGWATADLGKAHAARSAADAVARVKKSRGIFFLGIFVHKNASFCRTFVTV